MRRDEVVDALAEAIRQERGLLNVGITIQLSELPSWAEYKSLKEKMEQSGLSVTIRRYLFPGRYRQLWKRYIESQQAIQREVIDEVLSSE